MSWNNDTPDRALDTPEESTRPEPDDDHRDSAFYVDPTIDTVEHDFPIATKILALTLKIDDAIKAVRGSLYHGKQA